MAPKYSLTHAAAGSLKFRFEFAIEDAEYRTYYSGRYQPREMYFELASTGSPPRRKDLRASSILLRGVRIKNDGTPGKQETSEHLYFSEEWPSWVTDVITEAYEKMQED